ncbi:hypothetical protein [Spirosoma areae]
MNTEQNYGEGASHATDSEQSAKTNPAPTQQISSADTRRTHLGLPTHRQELDALLSDFVSAT